MNHALQRTLLAFTLCMTSLAALRDAKAQSASALSAMIKRFIPTEITGDTNHLSPGDRSALKKLCEASKIMDRIYLRQVWDGNEEMQRRLEADRTPLGLLRRQYFEINMGPWSRLDHNTPFIPNVPKRPPGANYYPGDMTKKEFTRWLGTLQETEKKKATGFFYTIRRDKTGTLTLVPYKEEYREFLVPAAGLLREAASLTTNPTLATYLSKRADAFLSDDYYESDVAWMDLDSPIDVTIGPYEVYQDELFNYKAAFEAFITLRDEEESNKLAKFSAYLQEIEDHLPVAPQFRNPKLGGMAPIRVVDVVLVGGEARAGVQTAAFNLPNDERVTSEKGSKRVMLKNVQEAKFKNTLVPISTLVLDPSQRSLVSFEPFFTHILAHELMHGLGPHNITVNGRATTVRQEMKEIGSALEEAKADIAGLFALQYLIDKGILEKSLEEHMYVSYLASTFRSIRFGLNDAHGKGMALQCNYLTDEHAIDINTKTGTYRVNLQRIKAAVSKLTGHIMTIQAEGNYEAAKTLLDRYGRIRPTMQKVLKILGKLPVDIVPIYPLAQ
jgi:hypothetical protein